MKGEGLDPNDLVVSGESETTSTGTQKVTPSVDKPEDSVAEFIFDLIEEYGKGFEVFAFSRHAEEAGKTVPEEWKEAYELPEYVETISWEDLFNLDLSEYEYVGYPPRDRDGDSVTYKEGFDPSVFTGDLTGETKKVLNGHFAREIQKRFAQNEDATPDNASVEVAIRKGKESDHPEDSEEEFFGEDSYRNSSRYQRIYIRSTDNTPERVIKSRQFVGEISESEAEELIADLDETEEEDDE